MTAITRRFCQRCRLQKCFAVGMRKEYIMSEEERLNKKQKIEQNRARKRAASHPDNPLGTMPSKRSQSSSSKCIRNTEWNSSDWSSSQLGDSQNSPEGAHSQERSPSQGTDSMADRLLESFPSPTSASSAGCVPSPNSPPDSATVAASRNTEMVEKMDSDVANKQGMISVITYPHHLSQVSEDNHRQQQSCAPETHYPAYISASTQTDLSLYNGHVLFKTSATQTADNVQLVSQSTPLLSSLICNQRVDESAGRHKEVSTSPPPLHSRLMKEGTGGWTGVDGVNGSSLAWDACAAAGNPSVKSVDEEILQDVFRVPGVSTSFDSFLSEAIKLEFSTYTPRAVTVPHIQVEGASQSKELNDAERAKLNELIVANKALLAPLEETSPDHRLLDIINLTAIAIRRLVKMAKKINAFKNMCQEDQVALLKGACMEMLILHSVTTYNPDKDSWALPHGTVISVNVLKESKGNLYQEHQRFQQSFDPKWKTDENIMLILSAISLFTPARANIVHKDVIKLEQNSYYYLLRRYLECTLPGCEARSTFFKLIQKISELHRLNEEHVRAYLDVDPTEVEPLLIEIFDLKPASLMANQ